ncbi:hypothetical protein ACS0TY_026714 [Phlomoides rotata]
MWEEIDIIVNSAAITKFDERYDVAFGINALGAMHVRDFAIKCSKLEMLLQVSTAFVHGTQAGLILEKPFHMGETLPGAKITYLDINTEKAIIEERLRALQTDLNSTEKDIARAMKDLGIERAMLHGWPNTYVFTKAMGEMVLEKFKEKANVIILRPTIITSTFRDPIPGWIEGVRTLDAIFAAYGKGKLKFFVGDPDSILDMIPGDMVVNSMVAAIARNGNRNGNDKATGGDLFVYHVGSSRHNPVTYAHTKCLMQRYLTQSPLLDDTTGNPIAVSTPKIFTTMSTFHNYISLHYLPFLKILKFINVLCWNYFDGVYTNATRNVNQALRLAQLYKPYLFSQAIFDDANTENLRALIRGSNMMNMPDMLNFDPKCIIWDDYFLNTHFQGLAKYSLK